MRLRTARERSGKSHKEVAAAIGFNLPSYYDLESQDDEMTMVVSLAELRDLGRVLGCDPVWLVTGVNRPTDTIFSTQNLADAIRKHLDNTGTPLDRFEDDVGWVVTNVLHNPDEILEWNVDCLIDVCRKVRVPWTSVLPG